MFSVTTIIAIITVLVSIAAFSNVELLRKLILNPYSVHKYNQWYRIVSCGLIHADWPHLIFNMIAFWSFGVIVESYYQLYFEGSGTFFYILLYLGGQIFSVLPTYARYKDFVGYNSLGASGAVSAIVFASILFTPWSTIYVFFFPVPAIIFGVIYLAFSQYMSKRGGDNINHDAHFYGAVFGLLFTSLLKFQIAIDFFDKLIHPQF